MPETKIDVPRWIFAFAAIFLLIVLFYFIVWPKPCLQIASQDYGHCASESTQSNSVGDLKWSVLKPVEFRKENGEDWVLLDGGKDLAEMDLEFDATRLFKEYGHTNIVDARGFFLRAYDNRLSDDVDRVDKDRSKSEVLTVQQSSGLDHTHLLLGNGNQADKDSFSLDSQSANVSGQRGGRASFHTNERFVSRAGGLESRPPNINFYLYIKVN